MSATLIDGNALASEMRRETANEVRTLKQIGTTPCLAACIVGDDPASHIYVSRKAKACDEVGIRSVCKHLPETVPMDELIHTIRRWNYDPTIHGILIQLPLPDHLNRSEIVNALDPDKDVDGFHAVNMGLIVHNKPNLRPCTPSAVQHILAAQRIPTDGKRITIINRSIVVGQPLALMLMQDGQTANATVTVCHNHTTDLKEITRGSDIVIVAVGRRPETGKNPSFRLSADMVKEGAVVIDVGINRLPSGKVIGDADQEVREVASQITPVPGGVGPLTISCLLKNTVTAAKHLFKRDGIG